MPSKDPSRVSMRVPVSIILQPGQHVVRKNSTERGTVVATGAIQIKVKRNRGRTSCYLRCRDGNVLALPPLTDFSRVQLIEALGEWFVRVTEEDGGCLTRTFGHEDHAVSFAEGQKKRPGLNMVTRI